jgi:hypothetical protein
MKALHHGLSKGEGRKLRRARNTVKRYSGSTVAKLKRRAERAEALLLASVLSRD